MYDTQGEGIFIECIAKFQGRHYDEDSDSSIEVPFEMQEDGIISDQKGLTFLWCGCFSTAHFSVMLLGHPHHSSLSVHQGLKSIFND